MALVSIVGEPTEEMTKRTLVAIASLLVLLSGCIFRERMSEDEKLREFGVYSEEDYSAMPVERQIEILIEMEPFMASDSSTRFTLSIAISQKGEGAVEPIVAAIRRLQSEGLLRPPFDGLAIGDLAHVLGLIHLHGRADLRETEAEALLQSIACRDSYTWAIDSARGALYMIRYDEYPHPDLKGLRDVLCGP